jgi:hypothetical protein
MAASNPAGPKDRSKDRSKARFKARFKARPLLASLSPEGKALQAAKNNRGVL